MKKWRLFEVKNNEYYTLFHSVNGSRKIPINQWIKAKQNIVQDGSGQKKKRYRAGFHVFDSPDIIKSFIKKFTMSRELHAVEIEIKGTIRKKPTNNSILLVSEIKIPENTKSIRVK